MIGFQIDTSTLLLLERIAKALESIATTLKPSDAIDPADIAHATETLRASGEALRKAIEEHPAPSP